MARKVHIILLLVLLMAAPATAYGSEYIHGFFRYTIADQSITITAYTGREEVVNVPAMIGSTPVNTIAAGAFANNRYVKTVYLPDTITTVEAGAFAAGQTVVYLGPTSQADATPLPRPTPRGIYAGNGELIAIDDEGNLLRVAKDGSAYVLDNQHKYTVTEENGEKIIRREDGVAVIIGENGSVILPGTEAAPVPTATAADTVATPAPQTTTTDASTPAISFEDANAPDDTPAPEVIPVPETEAPKSAEVPKATEAPKSAEAAKGTEAPGMATAEPKEAEATDQNNGLKWVARGLGVLLAVMVILVMRRRKRA